MKPFCLQFSSACTYAEISRAIVELKANVSENSSASIIRVDVVNDCMSLMFISVCQIDASSN
jgi:hypothetical protein